jgi:hypothetical protein
MSPLPLELFREAQSLGLKIDVDRDRQRLLVSPASKCPPEFAQRLRVHKAELLKWLSEPPCPGWGAVPPADLPLNPKKPRFTQEQRAKFVDYLLRQTGDQPGPLAAWLVRRESAIYDGPGRKWDDAEINYAAARDAVCWQLNRSEAEAHALLAGFEESAKSWGR